MWGFVRRLGFFLLLAFVLLFGFQNLEALSKTVKFELSFFAKGWQFVTPEFPVVFLLVAFFLLGMIAAGFQGFYEKLARNLDIRKRERRIKQLEREVSELRTRIEGEPAAAAVNPGGQEPAGSAAPHLEDNPTL